MARKRTNTVRKNRVKEEIIPDEQMREDLESLGTQLDEGHPIHPEEPEDPESNQSVGPEPECAEPAQLETNENVEHIVVSGALNQSGKSIPMTYASLASLGMSKLQIHSILTMMIFADCAIQKSPEGIFDVLARNFPDVGFLSWFLNRIGHNEKTKYAKGRDLVEYFRKVAHELYRDLKEVGKPVARF